MGIADFFNRTPFTWALWLYLWEAGLYLAWVPELPEVEVLARSLGPQLKDKTIRSVWVGRVRVLGITTVEQLTESLVGGRFLGVSRRGKYLLFTLQSALQPQPLLLVGHLGMTGRMYLQPAGSMLPKHAAVVLGLGGDNFIFEDPRYFGRFTLEAGAIENLGPEPLGEEFTIDYFTQALRRSEQPVKVKLLDQGLVAGIGNIYASEALFRAGISPSLASRRLKADQVASLWQAIREVLAEAIEWGSTVRLDFPGTFGHNRLFYFGSAEPGGFSVERLRVYDHADEPCPRCKTLIKRMVQGNRSTYFCPGCQKR